MDTEIGTTFKKLTSEEVQELTPLLEEMGDRFLYTNADGTAEIRKITEPEVTPLDEIYTLKAYLSETDYTVIKCMELGVSISEAYPEIHQKRSEARARINELEEVINDSNN